MKRSVVRGELSFLFALWKANLLSAMEFRASFVTQILGMMLNNAIYFIFWIIFFNRFDQVRGWGLSEMLLIFGVVACGFGLAVFLFGNAVQLSNIISQGRLDYYLSLPRPVLLHAIASKSIPSGLGDFTYGIMSFVMAGLFSADTILRYVLGILLSTTTFLSFLIIVNSLAFWIGNARMLSSQATNAIVTFALYPITIFDGSARIILYTLLPAALIGAVPVEFVRTFSWGELGQLLGSSLIFLVLATVVFHRGLRRYESGSAFQIQS